MRKIIFALVFCLCGCALSVSYDDVHQQINSNPNLLPALKTKVDTQNLRASFADLADYENNSDKKRKDTMRLNMIVNDAVNIFEREVEENITVGSGEKKGYISFKVQYVELKDSVPVRVATIAGLGLLNIAGFPYNTFTQTMEAEIEIMDKKQNVIKRYTEIVESSESCALYWGYKRREINRKISAENVKKFLEIVRKKINNDAEEIKAKLK